MFNFFWHEISFNDTNVISKKVPDMTLWCKENLSKKYWVHTYKDRNDGYGEYPAITRKFIFKFKKYEDMIQFKLAWFY